MNCTIIFDLFMFKEIVDNQFCYIQREFMEIAEIIVKSYYTMNYQITDLKNYFNDDLRNFKNLDDNFRIHQVNFNKKIKISFSYFHKNTLNPFKYHILTLPWLIFNCNLVIGQIDQIDKLFFKFFIDDVFKNLHMTITDCCTFFKSVNDFEQK